MELKGWNDGDFFLIGDDPETGEARYYKGEPGLVTIAPPGSGKTQCHMLPNLLTWRGPAIVLDVTGELWDKTSKRRSEFGPVYRLDPDHVEQSDCYNPFDVIRTDPFHVWEDAHGLASLVYSQAGADADGKFFDAASIDYIAAFACYIVHKLPPHARTMETLLRFVAGSSLHGFLTEAAKVKELPGLQNAATLLLQSDERTKGNVAWTAKNCLSPWENPPTIAISRVSDWHPEMVREHNATVYICLSLEKMKSHRAFVRLVVGQHLRAMMRHKIDRSTPWVQFFIDETPQLRHMDVLLQAIEAGRGFHVRVWMVMQWKGQLETAYGEKTAQGMIAACGLQAYLNPSLQDGSAQALAEQIGKQDHPFDQTQQRLLVTPQQLSGDTFRNDMVAFVGGKPVRLRKHPFHGDAALKAMAGAAP